MDDSSEHQSDEEESEDVAQLLGMLKRAQSDNVELRRNFESLKELHLQQNNDYKQLQARYSSLYEERVTVERQYQALCESWRVELEEKQKQFERVKAQILGPRDLEMLKLKMIEKVEAPFRAKCDMLAREAEAAQQSFVRQRREFEELQAAHKAMELHSQQDRENLVADYTASTSELRDKLAALGQVQAKMLQAEARSTSLERDKQDLIFQLSRLREEIEELRKAKERVNVEKGSIELRVERKVKSIQAEEMQLSGLVETLTRKNRHLQKELADAHGSNQEMFEQRLRLQAAQASLQSQLDTLRKAHAIELSAQEEQHLLAARALEDKLLMLRDEIHDKERQKAELHMMHQEQVTQLLNGHSHKVDALESENSQRVRELKEQQAELAAKVEALKEGLEESHRAVDDLQHKARREAESSQRQLERVQAQLSDSQRQSVSRDVELSELKGELDQKKGDLLRLEVSSKQLEQQREALQVQGHKLADEIQQLNEAKRELTKGRDDLKIQAEQLRASHLEQCDQQRHSFAMEKSALSKRYQAAMKELHAKHEAEVRKLRKRCKAADKAAAALGHEVSELKIRSELDLMAGYVPDVVPGRDGQLYKGEPWLARLPFGALLPPYSMPPPGRGYDETGGARRQDGPGEAGGGGASLSAQVAEQAAQAGSLRLLHAGMGMGRVEEGLSADIAALRTRQQDYLRASLGA